MDERTRKLIASANIVHISTHDTGFKAHEIGVVDNHKNCYRIIGVHHSLLIEPLRPVTHPAWIPNNDTALYIVTDYVDRMTDPHYVYKKRSEFINYLGSVYKNSHVPKIMGAGFWEAIADAIYIISNRQVYSEYDA